MAKGAFWIVVLVLGIACSAGCNTGEKAAPVEGMVTLDGQPLADVHIIFYRQNTEETNQENYRYTGLTDAQGRFVMHGEDGLEGVPPGKYEVTLTTAVAKLTDDETTPLPPERIPPKHRKKEFEVPAEGAKEAKFELTSR